MDQSAWLKTLDVICIIFLLRIVLSDDVLKLFRFFRTTYIMQNNCDFCGQDFAQCQNKQQFVKVLQDKIYHKTHVKINYIKVLNFDNSHSQYVVARLAIIAPKGKIYSNIHAIEDWFWDPSNALLNFKRC